MATRWACARHPRAYAGELKYSAIYMAEKHTPIPHIKGIAVSIHETSDCRFFIGARLQRDEPKFPPRFQPSLEAAKVYIELVKD